jgi:diguanylate cyclase (GGDEF)-like protein/PAS domain S-box-containing protein
MDRLSHPEAREAPDEEICGRLAQIAAAALRTHIAFIVLVGDDRWFGADAAELSPTHSLCRLVVSTGEPLVLADARGHPALRAAGARLEPGMVAFIGVPLLVAGGQVAGAFCSVDRLTREWSPGDVAFLRDLAATAATVLDLSAATRAREREIILLREDAESFESLFNASAEAIVVTEHGRIIAANATLTALLGYSREELLGRSPIDLTLPEDRAMIAERIHGGYNAPYEARHRHKDGSIVVLEAWGRPIRYRGRPARLATLRDISARRATETALRESEERFRSLVQHSSDVITVIQENGRQSYTSPSLARILGYDTTALPGRDLLALLHPEDAPEAARHFRTCSERPGAQATISFRIQHQDGSWRHFEAILTNLLDNPSVRGIVANARDVTTREEVEAALRASERRFRSLLDVSPDLKFRFSRDGVYRDIHAPDPSLLARSPEELLGRSVEEVMPPDFAAEALRKIARTLDTGTMQVFEYRLNVAGGLKDFEARLVVSGPDEVLYIVRDISKRKALEAQLTHQAFHDPLTGLPNRALFLDRLAQALARARRAEQPCAVLFLDLDRFKVVNDNLGHDAGDRLLVSVAERLSSCLRAEDTLARFGGDEFTVLLEGLDERGDALAVAERLGEALRQPVVLGGREMSATASIGIALYHGDGEERPEDLLRFADVAMYRAKSEGKDGYAVFFHGMQTGDLERLALEADLRRAVERGELEVHYQPIVDLPTGEIAEVEALVRWRHPERGLIPPSDFIPLAEEIGLIRPIGQWVLREACRQGRAWHEQYPERPPLTVAVNLSAREFGQPALDRDVAHILAETGLPARCLHLEITESVAMRDADMALAIFAALRELGVRLVIDDFGTGYSSLAYLQRLRVDGLKIDRAFVDDLATNPTNLRICEAIASLAHILGLAVTAEGVEQATQVEILRHFCDRAQGHYFSRPLPAAKIGELLAAGSIAHEVLAWTC